MCSKKFFLLPFGVVFLITSSFSYHSKADQMTYKMRPFGNPKTLKTSSHDHHSLPIHSHPILNSYAENVHVQKKEQLQDLKGLNPSHPDRLYPLRIINRNRLSLYLDPPSPITYDSSNAIPISNSFVDKLPLLSSVQDYPLPSSAQIPLPPSSQPQLPSSHQIPTIEGKA